MSRTVGFPTAAASVLVLDGKIPKGVRSAADTEEVGAVLANVAKWGITFIESEAPSSKSNI